MTDPEPGAPGGEPPEKIPLGQRLLDSPYLLLVACVVIMLVFYSGWGVVELAMLDEAPLP
jgi:hypothetical protein